MSVSLGTVSSFNVINGSGTSTYTAGSENVLLVIYGVSGNGLSTATCTGVGTATRQAYTSGGGYCGTVVFTIANPTSGTLSASFGSIANGAVFFVPLIGANTTTPIGTVVGGTQSPTNTPSSGAISGVDSSGIYLGFVNSTYPANSLTTESTGWTNQYSVGYTLQNIWAHLASLQTSSATATYTPTLANGGSNNAAIGFYVNSGTLTATRVRRTRNFIPVFFPR